MWRFHRASIILLICSVATLLAADELSNDERRMYVELHNSYRSRAYPQAADMKKMELDVELETLAKESASRCVFEHGNPPNKFEGPIGQNIFMFTNRADIVVEAIKRFQLKNENYSLGSNTCQSGKVCGHYTQLMWAQSYKVGCGVSSKCTDNSYIFVCNYAPAGNIVGQKPYVQGTSCSSCENGWGGCSGNLCTRINAPDAENKAARTAVRPIAQPTRLTEENLATPSVKDPVDKPLTKSATETGRKVEQFLELVKSYDSRFSKRFSKFVSFFSELISKFKE